MIHRLAQIRKTLGLTQAELAAKLDTSQRNIGYLESEPGRLDDEWVRKISKALKIHPATLFMEPTLLPNEGESVLLTAYRQADDATKGIVNKILEVPFFESGEIEAVIISDPAEKALLERFRAMDSKGKASLTDLTDRMK